MVCEIKGGSDLTVAGEGDRLTITQLRDGTPHQIWFHPRQLDEVIACLKSETARILGAQPQ